MTEIKAISAKQAAQQFLFRRLWLVCFFRLDEMFR